MGVVPDGREAPGSAPGGGEGTPPAGEAGAVTGQDWLVRLVPMALLIMVGLAGLRGAAGTPRWNGPLHDDVLAVGVVLEVLIVTLLVILLRRRRRGAQEATAVKLRGVLMFVLSAGGVAAAVLVVVGLHLRASGHAPRPAPVATPGPRRTPSLRPARPVPGFALHISLTVLLYALLIAVLLAGVAASIWWARRLRPPTAAREDDFIAEDPEVLREAVESGRSALRTVDDARAAIIACYLAMEASLAERGTARGIADTPGELLTRAREGGLVRGAAAGRLTALFYEARFSSHPLGVEQRGAAERALDELAADLAEPETAGAGG